MSNRIEKIAAAAAIIVAAPVLASAQSVAYDTSSPVAITALSVDAAYAPGTIGGEAAEAPQFLAKLDSGYITLKLVNKSGLPATTVTFLVTNGLHTQRIVDKGTSVRAFR